MKVHSALAGVLAERGITAAFGVMGDANMFFIDSLVREQHIRYVAAANEAGAVMMAAGFSIRSAGVGVATVTYGPGLLNAVPNLVTAARQRTPMIVVTGETSGAKPGHSQHIDQESFADAAGVGYIRVAQADGAAHEFNRAVKLSLAQRRPYVFACPVDFMFSDCAAGPSREEPTAALAPADPQQWDRAAGLIVSAKRPLVLAGYGCVLSGAEKQVTLLAEALGAPLMTTLPAKGLFARNGRHLGVCGTFSTPEAVEALQRSDCIIAIGTSLDRLTGGGDGWPYFDGVRLIQCDNNPRAIRPDGPQDVAVVADAAGFSDSITEMLGEIGHAPSSFWQQCIDSDDGCGSDSAGVDQLTTVAALTAVNDALPSARMVAVDGGRFAADAITHLAVPDALSWAASFAGFGAVGNAVSMTLGMCCAQTDMTGVAVVGDGGFMLGGLAEFNTAVRYGLDLVVVVINDRCYGAEQHKLEQRGFSAGLSMFNWPDLAEAANALGGSGVAVAHPGDLAGLRNALRDRTTPVLVDIKVNSAERE